MARTKVKALILAGGYGERLWPLTKNIPKPMLSVLGKSCLEWIIENLEKCGIEDIMIYMHYKHEMIYDYFNSRAYFDYTPELSGTAQTVWRNQERLGNNFLVINGDTLIEPKHIKFLIDLKNPNVALYDNQKYSGIMKVNKSLLPEFEKHLMIEDVLPYLTSLHGFPFVDIGDLYKDLKWINL